MNPLFERLIAAVLTVAIKAWLKKQRDDAQVSLVTEAIDDFRKAKTREEKVLANKKLSESFKVR